MSTFAFLYRCPITGHKVQGLVHAPAPSDSSTYETVTCTACNRVHLVNAASGHVAGTDLNRVAEASSTEHP